MLSPEREGRLTASWHPDALGYGYSSWPQCWRRWRGEPLDERAMFHVERGIEHEKDAVGFCEGVLGEIVECSGDEQSFVPFESWSGCTPDGFIGDLALVEAKCPTECKPKDSYWVQIQSQLHITGRTVGFLSVWTPDEQGLWRTTRDPGYWPIAELHLKAFHEYLKAEECPKKAKRPRLSFNISWEKVA